VVVVAGKGATTTEVLAPSTAQRSTASSRTNTGDFSAHDPRLEKPVETNN
jgi:predicted oxidoreductase